MNIFGLIDIPIWLLLIISTIVLIYLYLTWNLDIYKDTGIPGPPPSTVYLLKKMFKDGLVDTQTELIKTYGPVVGLFMGRIPTCIVGDPELIKEICVKQATSNFPDRLVNSSVPKQLENSMQFLEGEHWKFVRGHISPTFSTGKLKETVPLIHKCCDTLMVAIDRLSKTDENIDTKKLFACFSMDIIASISFGMEIDSQDDPNNKFVKHANSLMVNKKAVFIAMVCLIFPFMKKVFAYFNIWGGGNEALDFFERATAAAIEERIKGKQERKDFLQLMINARKEGVVDPEYKPANPEEWKNRGLTNGEIYANSMLFFVAAYETVSLNLTFLAYSLAINPEVQDELIDEIDRELRGVRIYWS
ncbi:cytochrome P450 3A24 [Patella vulgata]|uniref:cytochrome P450 3A24 n=1 Tax=Patella vulgata TaxID=6465 RepID=UPI0024A8260B|nr:cytochrome P450 3A24 [Patella vulgata]